MFAMEVSRYNRRKRCKTKSKVKLLEDKVESFEAILNKLLAEGREKIKASAKPKLERDYE